ncbi:MAG: helix-turn-helix transcriptional regulator [Anaerolineae bacterium]|nr:helix-turn-helix transcriptional regulator [Anaerolineae bacterium]
MHLPTPTIDTAPALAFCYQLDAEPEVHHWHRHARHQLLFASTGVLHLELETVQWLVPPQRAAWVTAGDLHLTRFLTSVSLRSICYDPAFPGLPPSHSRVFSMTPLAREMILYGMRWSTDRDPNDHTANLFFQTFAVLLRQWLAEERPYRLPRAKSPELERAMTYTLTHLSEIQLDEAANVANLSARTLRRRMKQETGISWQQFLHDARMMRAMELLALPEAQVTDTAFTVGYTSLSAFTQAFTRFTGETPSHYRHRVQSA